MVFANMKANRCFFIKIVLQEFLSFGQAHAAHSAASAAEDHVLSGAYHFGVAQLQNPHLFA